MVPQYDPLEQPEVFHSLSHQAGMTVQRALGQPFENQGHGEHGMTVDHVRPDHRQRTQVDPPLKHRLQLSIGLVRPRTGRALALAPALGSGTSGDSGSDVRGTGQDHDLDRAIAARVDLIHEQPGSVRRRNQPQTLALKHRLQCAGHHAAVPWSPVERHDSTGGKPPRHALGPLVQPFVGRRIGRLANPAVAGGGRREKGEESKLPRIDRVKE